MLQEGLLAKPTQKNIIRFSPPLVITEEQLNEACTIIEKAWKNCDWMEKSKIIKIISENDSFLYIIQILFLHLLK